MGDAGLASGCKRGPIRAYVCSDPAFAHGLVSNATPAHQRPSGGASTGSRGRWAGILYIPMCNQVGVQIRAHTSEPVNAQAARVAQILSIQPTGRHCVGRQWSTQVMERANLVAIGVACLLGASAAMATEPSSSASSSSSTTSAAKSEFSAADTNHDGYISKSEAQQAGMADYSTADRNGDGKLDANEFATALNSTHSSQGMSSSSQSASSSMSKPSDSTTSRTP
jgi:hypothetical protein